MCVFYTPSRVTHGRVTAGNCDGVEPYVKCRRGGYRDPNDCTKCKCPEGYGERECGDPAIVSGGKLSLLLLGPPS